MKSDDETGSAFGSGEPFSVGVEEELFLVDPVTGRQANASAVTSFKATWKRLAESRVSHAKAIVGGFRCACPKIFAAM